MRSRAWRRLCGALLFVLAASAGCGGGEPEGEVAAPEPIEAETAEVRLYFPGSGGRLYPEVRELPGDLDTEGRIRALVGGLLAGPSDPALFAPLPEGVALATVYRTADGTVYLNLEAPEAGPPPSAGSTEEIQIVYSIVNSVAENVSSVDRVAILWNGVQRTTLTGHLDVSRPLAPNRGLVATPQN